MTSLFDNGLLRKAIVHPTQFLGFEFISTEKFLLFSNENFQSIEKYLNLKHSRPAIDVDSSVSYKMCRMDIAENNALDFAYYKYKTLISFKI